MAVTNNFAASSLDLNGQVALSQPTALVWGPDGRLYVTEVDGDVKVLSVAFGDKNPGDGDATAQFYVTSSVTLSLIKGAVQNHNDNGTENTGANRQVTGIDVTPQFDASGDPVLINGKPAVTMYVTSSDSRIGAGGGGNDANLDTNSGVITMLTQTAPNTWTAVDIVRGLSRSEENHATNGLEVIQEIDPVTGTLISERIIVTSGGNANTGAPSNNFAGQQEQPLSAAILEVDLTMLKSMPVLNDAGRAYVYDIPTLNDPSRTDVGGADVNDPFGGNDGRNSAKLLADGPVSIYSPGYRNAYDVEVTEDGRVWTYDNGANDSWGGRPIGEAGDNGVATDNPQAPGYIATNLNNGEGNSNDDINLVNWNPSNKDNFHEVTRSDDLNGGTLSAGQGGAQTFVHDGLTYVYGGHPNPTRAEGSRAGLLFSPDAGTDNAYLLVSNQDSYGDGGLTDYEDVIAWLTTVENNNTAFPSSGIFGAATGDLTKKVLAVTPGVLYDIYSFADGSGAAVVAGGPAPANGTLQGQAGLPSDIAEIVAYKNPIEGDYNEAGKTDGALDTGNGSINGLAEYTSTILDDGSVKMSGAILATVLGGGNIIVMGRNADGTMSSVVNGGFATAADRTVVAAGGSPLGIATVGDNFIENGLTQPFQGSIWTAVYGQNGPLIEVFQPNNGAVPLAGSEIVNPTDRDLDGVGYFADPFEFSDVNGFAIAPGETIILDFDPQNTSFPTSLNSTGLLGAALDGGTPNRDAQTAFENFPVDQQFDGLYDIGGNVLPGGNAPILQIKKVIAGTVVGAANTARDVLHTGVLPSPDTDRLVATMTMKNWIPAEGGVAPGQLTGMIFGDGTQANFVRFVFGSVNGQPGLEVGYEIGDANYTVVEQIAVPALSNVAISTLELRLSINMEDGFSVAAAYRLDGETAFTDLGGFVLPVGVLRDVLTGAHTIGTGAAEQTSGAAFGFLAETSAGNDLDAVDFDDLTIEAFGNEIEADTAAEVGGTGSADVDTVIYTGTETALAPLAANVENFDGTGSAADYTVTGNALNNVIRTGTGANTVTTGAGEDALRGTLAQLAGDEITDFSADDKVMIEGETLNGLTIGYSASGGAAVVTVNGQTITFSGDDFADFDPVDGPSTFGFTQTEDGVEIALIQPETVLYRVNAGSSNAGAGAGTIAAIDGGPDWVGDATLINAAGPISVTGATVNSYTQGLTNEQSEIEEGNVDLSVVPWQVFVNERSDNTNDATKLTYNFEVEAGKTYKITLYYTENWNGIFGFADSNGGATRQFDVTVEGQDFSEFQDINPMAETVALIGGPPPAGADSDAVKQPYLGVAFERTLTYTAGDNLLTLEWEHETENPKVNAIQISVLGGPAQPPADTTAPVIASISVNNPPNVQDGTRTATVVLTDETGFDAGDFIGLDGSELVFSGIVPETVSAPDITLSNGDKTATLTYTLTAAGNAWPSGVGQIAIAAGAYNDAADNGSPAAQGAFVLQPNLANLMRGDVVRAINVGTTDTTLATNLGADPLDGNVVDNNRYAGAIAADSLITDAAGNSIAFEADNNAWYTSPKSNSDLNANVDGQSGPTGSNAGGVDLDGSALHTYRDSNADTWTATYTGFAPGAYIVELHFAELFHTAAGSRVGDFFVNGQLVADDYDAFAAASGADKPSFVRVPVTVVDGTITVTVDSSAGQAGYSAFVAYEAVDPNLPPTISVGDVQAVEGGDALVTFTRTGDLSEAVTVTFVVTPGTASTADFTAPVQTSVVIPANQGSVGIAIPLVNDTDEEEAESFTVSIQSVSNTSNDAVIADGVATVTIAASDSSLQIPAGGTILELDFETAGEPLDEGGFDTALGGAGAIVAADATIEDGKLVVQTADGDINDGGVSSKNDFTKLVDLSDAALSEVYITTRFANPFTQAVLEGQGITTGSVPQYAQQGIVFGTGTQNANEVLKLVWGGVANGGTGAQMWSKPTGGVGVDEPYTLASMIQAGKTLFDVAEVEMSILVDKSANTAAPFITLFDGTGAIIGGLRPTATAGFATGAPQPLPQPLIDNLASGATQVGVTSTDFGAGFGSFTATWDFVSVTSPQFVETPVGDSDSVRGTVVGDFADTGAAPTDIGALLLGDNVIVATQQGDSEPGGRDRDYFTFTVADGQVLSQLVLQGFETDDTGLPQGFIGIQAGAVVTADPVTYENADELLGGLVYNDGLLNNDILPTLGDGNEQGVTFIGFTAPLPAGTYTVWLNQGGIATTATLNFIVSETVVPAFILSIADAPTIAEDGDTGEATLLFALAATDNFSGTVTVTYDALGQTGLTQDVTFTNGAGELSVAVSKDNFDNGDDVVSVTLTAAEDGGSNSFTFGDPTASGTVSEDDAAPVVLPKGALVFAVNAGGAAVTDTNGVTYEADVVGNWVGASNTYSDPAAQQPANGDYTGDGLGNADDTVYVSERWGGGPSQPNALTFQRGGLTPGDYVLTLKFADIFNLSAAGTRIFDVTVNGVQVINDLDLIATVGLDRAYDIDVPVTVGSDGLLRIAASASVDNAKISAIALFQAPLPDGQIAIANAPTLVETGDADSTTLLFPLTLGGSDAIVTIDYTVNGGAPQQAEVTFVSGVATLSVPVANDNTDNGPDGVTVVLTGASAGFSIAPTAGSASGTVTEDDVADPNDIDGDGILNTDDPFAYDGANGDARQLVAGVEFTQDFETDTANPFSPEAGFTGILVNPAFNYGPPADPAADPYGNRTNETGVSISGGTLNILSTETDAFSTGTGTNNTLADAYQSAVDVTGVNSFEVHARASSAQWLAATGFNGFAQFGISLGAGGVDDFVKLVLSDGGTGAPRVQIAHNNSLVGGEKNLPVGGTGTGDVNGVAGPTVDLSLVGDIEFRLIVDRAAGANGQITGQMDFFAADGGALLVSYTTPAFDILAGSSLVAALNGENPLTGGDGGLAYGVVVSDWNAAADNRITANYDFLTIRALDEVPDTPPTVAAGIVAQTANEDTPFIFTVPADAFADDGGAANLTLSATLADDAPLPTWLSFSNGVFSGTPENADVGSIDVKVTATDAGGLSVSQTFALEVTNTNDAPTGTVTITGTAAQGQTLTADVSTLDDADGLGTIGYQWFAGGVAIDGATGATLVLGQAEVGKAITVTASYTDDGGQAESVTSAATPVVTNENDAPTGAVTITGTATQGETLTASNDLADPDGLGSISYQWFADDVAIDGATGETLVLGQAEVGKAITVTASYTDGGGTAESVSSAATALVTNDNDAPTGAVTITGTATQGETLTASNDLADPDGLGSISYQWFADDVAIDGATGETLVLGQAEVGKAITVTASYTDGGGTAESVASEATAAVTDVPETAPDRISFGQVQLPAGVTPSTAPNELGVGDLGATTGIATRATVALVGDGDGALEADETAFVLAGAGTGATVPGLGALNEAADPVTVSAHGRVDAGTVGGLDAEAAIGFLPEWGFGVKNGEDANGRLLASGDSVTWTLNSEDGTPQRFKAVSFIVDRGTATTPAQISIDFDGDVVNSGAYAAADTAANADAALTLSASNDDVVAIDFDARTVTINDAAQTGAAIEAFFAAWDTSPQNVLTIGGVGAGFSVEDLVIERVAYAGGPVNLAPTAVTVTPVLAAIAEGTLAVATKVADIAVTDDALGTNVLSLTGADADLFEIVGPELFLKAGAALDFETNPSLDVTVEVDDASLGGTPDASASFTLAVTDVAENAAPTGVTVTPVLAEIAEGTLTVAVKVADIAVTDDALGTNVLSLTGADADLFEIVGAELFLKAGAALDFETNPSLDVTVEVDDASLGATPDATAAFSLAVTDVNETPPDLISFGQVQLKPGVTPSTAPNELGLTDVGGTTGAANRALVALVGDGDGALEADETAFVLAGAGTGATVPGLGALNDAADPVTVSAHGRVDAGAVGALADDSAVAFAPAWGFGVKNGVDANGRLLANGDSLTWTLNSEDGTPQRFKAVQFTLDRGAATTATEVAFDFDGQLLSTGAYAAAQNAANAQAALRLGGVFNNDVVAIDFDEGAITVNGVARTGAAIDAFFDAYELSPQNVLTIGGILAAGFSVRGLTIERAAYAGPAENLPATVVLENVAAELPETTDLAAPFRVADIVVTDDGMGVNTLSLSGADAALFEIIDDGLFVKAGAFLDARLNPQLDVTVAVDDAAIGDTPDASIDQTITVTRTGVDLVSFGQVQLAPTVIPGTAPNELTAADVGGSTSIANRALAALVGDGDQSVENGERAYVLAGAGSGATVPGLGTLNGEGDPVILSAHGRTSTTALGALSAEAAIAFAPSWGFGVKNSEEGGGRTMTRGDSVTWTLAEVDGVPQRLISARFTVDTGTSTANTEVSIDFDGDVVASGTATTAQIASRADAALRLVAKNNDVIGIDFEAGTVTLNGAAETGAAIDAFFAAYLASAGNALTIGGIGTVALSVENLVLGRAATAAINQAPTAVTVTPVLTMIAEGAVAVATKVADIAVTDDGLGTNALSLTGADAALFEIVGTGLFLKAGAALDFETNPSLDVTVQVDDASLGATPDASAAFALAVTDVAENAAPTAVILTPATLSLAENLDTTNAVKVADIAVTDDGLGTNALSLAGDDAALFEIVGTGLFLKAGAALDFETNPSLDVTVQVDDADVGGSPDASATFSLAVTNVDEPVADPFAPEGDLDGDAILNAVDSDVDGDGAPNINDPFAYDAQNGMALEAGEVKLFGFDVDGTIYQNGMTGFLQGTTTTAGFNEDTGAASVSGGLMTVNPVTAGDTGTSNNPQDDAVVGVRNGTFVATAVVVNPWAGAAANPNSFDQLGLVMGLNSNDMIKLVFGQAGGVVEFQKQDTTGTTTTALKYGGTNPAGGGTANVALPAGVTLDTFAKAEITFEVVSISTTSATVTGTIVFQNADGTEVGRLDLPAAPIGGALAAALADPAVGVAVGFTHVDGGGAPGFVAQLDSLTITEGDGTAPPVNQAPTAVTLTNVVAGIVEGTSVATKVADIVVADDGLGTNELGLTGADAGLFEIIGQALFLKAGETLEAGTNPTLDVAVTVDDASLGNTPDATSVALAIPVTVVPSEQVVLRINAFGPQVAAIDGGPNWLADNGAGYVYLTAPDNRGDAPAAGYTGSPGAIPAGVPEAVLDTARSGDQPFSYNIPVDDIGGAGFYRVNLYVAELFAGGQATAFRIFDASLEGAVPVGFDNITTGTAFGANVGVLSAEVQVTDGVLNIGFLQDAVDGVQNPIVNAIEVVRLSGPPADTVAPTAVITLTNPADANAPLLVSIALSDASGIDASTLGTEDLQLQLSGVPAVATVSFTGFAAGVATYQIAAPAQGWTNGLPLTVTLPAGQIADLAASANVNAAVSESLTLTIGGGSTGGGSNFTPTGDLDGDGILNNVDPNIDGAGAGDGNQNDPFAYDAGNGVLLEAGQVIDLDFNTDGTAYEAGFTGLLQGGAAGTTLANFTEDTGTATVAGGTLNVTASTGDTGTSNDPEDDFQLGVKNRAFTVEARIVNPFDGAAANFQQLGVHVGIDSTDFVKFVFGFAGGVVEFSSRNNDVETKVSGGNIALPAALGGLGGFEAVDITMVVNATSATAATVQAFATFLDGAGQPIAGATNVSFGTASITGALAAALFDESVGVGAGFTQTSLGGGGTFPAQLDNFKVTGGGGGGTVVPPDPGNAEEAFESQADLVTNATYGAGVTGAAVLKIMEGDNGVASSNFGANSFEVENIGGKKISAIFIDATSALYQDAVFDPDGLGGDNAAKAWAVNSAGGTGGYVTGSGYFLPGQAPIANSGGSGGVSNGGFKGAMIKFNPTVDGGFQLGEVVGFSGDMDPNSIAGMAKSAVDSGATLGWDVGGISGHELIGSLFTVLFDDGTTASGQLISDTSNAGSIAIASQGLAAEAVSLVVNGVTEGGVGTYGATPPTVIVTGDPGQLVRVTMTRGFDPVTNETGGVDDLVTSRLARYDFKANNAYDEQSFDVTIGANGTFDASGLFDYGTASGTGKGSFTGDTTAPIGFVASAIGTVAGDVVALGPVTAPIYLTNLGGPVVGGGVGPGAEGYYQIIGTGNSARFKVQVEDPNANGGTNPGGDWTYVAGDDSPTQVGTQGTGHYFWGSETTAIGVNNPEANSFLNYTIFIPEGQGGVYNFRVRSSRDTNEPTDQRNDVWLRIDEDAEELQTNATNSVSSGGFVKVFGAGTSWGFASQIDSVSEAEANFGASFNLSEGLHTITLAGRSDGFHIDYWELHKGGAPALSATNSAFVNSGPTAPAVVSPIADQQIEEGDGYSFTVPAGTFDDLDGDTLGISISAPAGFTVNGTTITAGTGLALGDYTIVATATDDDLNTVSDTFVVSVVEEVVTTAFEAVVETAQDDIEVGSSVTSADLETNLTVQMRFTVGDGVANVTNVTSALLSWQAERAQSGTSTLTFQVENSQNAQPFGTGKTFIGGSEVVQITGAWADNATITNVVDLADQLNALIASQGPLDAGDTINLQVTGTGATRYIQQASAVLDITAGASGGGGGGTGGSGTTSAAIAAGNSDIEISTLPTSVLAANLTSTNLEFGTDNFGSVDPAEPQKVNVVGMRFTGLDVPDDAEITSAYLEFEAFASSSVASDFDISIQNSLTGAVFTSVTNFTERNFFGAVDWTPGAWVAGQTYRSSDISSLIEGLIGAGGLDAADALVFRVTGAGVREAHSFEGTGAAPVLVINYAEDGGGPAPVDPTIAIADVATPVTEGGSASFVVSLSGPAAGPVSVTYSTTNGSAVAPFDFTAATNATVTIPAGQTSATITVPTINDTSSEGAETFSVQIAATLAGTPLTSTKASATVTIAASDLGDTGTPGSTTSIIAASSDDFETVGGAGSNDLEFGVQNGSPNAVALRFTGLELSETAEIESAYFIFQSEANNTGATNLSIEVENSTSAAPYSTTANLNGRNFLPSVVEWNNVEAWQTNQTYQSPDISPLIEALAGQDGLETTDALGFRFTGTGLRQAYSFNSSGDAPQLVINYVDDFGL